MANAQQEDFVRRRITELRLSKNISEHKMSLDLDKKWIIYTWHNQRSGLTVSERTV